MPRLPQIQLQASLEPQTLEYVSASIGGGSRPHVAELLKHLRATVLAPGLASSSLLASCVGLGPAPPLALPPQHPNLVY